MLTEMSGMLAMVTVAFLKNVFSHQLEYYEELKVRL